MGSQSNASDLLQFDTVFEQLVEDVTSMWPECEEISDAMDWFRKVTTYNVPHGKKNRGLTVVHSVQYLDPNATEAQLHRARILGWCVEWLQAFFLVADDVMDHSETRRGQKCWYKNSNVGLIAINDSFYLESSIYVILRKYFREESYYSHLLELFHECTIQTVIGQNLDLITAPEDHLDFSAFTLKRYESIVRWKTAFYSFYLPVACAMYTVGISDSENHKNAKTILLQMGEYFQIQDDYLDCFGDPAVTGKIGTDIEDNKCSWLVVQALSRATEAQRKILEDNYAQNDANKVAKVKALYDDLKLRDLYQKYEDESYESLSNLIHDLHGSLPKDMFIAYQNKIYKRKK